MGDDATSMAVYRQPQVVVVENDDDSGSADPIAKFNSASNLVTSSNANTNKTSLIDKKKQKWQQDKRKRLFSLAVTKNSS